MAKLSVFSKDALRIDAAQEAERIIRSLRENVHHKLRRQGAVLGISGGIDSSTVLALCARAFGPERVIALLLPERESDPDSAILAQRVADCVGVRTATEDITSALEGFGCYRRRDEAIRRVFPEFLAGWKAKIVLPKGLLDRNSLNVFSLVVTKPNGEEATQRLSLHEYYQIVAASNFKQRTRMAMVYYHAELHNYAVIGTANKDEFGQGFFVKHGDGGIDVNPILHLFKTQVYQLARHLGIPEQVQRRTPTSDTYSGESTQEEFFFRVPFDILDLIWCGYERGVPNDEIAAAVELSVEQVERVIADIVRKQRTTAYQRSPMLTVEGT